jgi:hypothetical protein
LIVRAIDTISRWASKFAAYVDKNGEEKTFEFLLTGVALAGLLALLVKGPQRVSGSIRAFLAQRRQMRLFAGRYFMFHGPTADGFDDAPRVTRLIIRSPFVGRREILQESITPHRRVHIGTPIASYSLLSGLFKPWDSAIKDDMDPRFKMLMTLPFKQSANGGPRVSIGAMTGANLVGEPWHVSVLISSHLLPADLVRRILAHHLNTAWLSEKLLHDVVRTIDDTPPFESFGTFNHPWGASEHIGKDLVP